jgi:hypothetical protein
MAFGSAGAVRGYIVPSCAITIGVTCSKAVSMITLANLFDTLDMVDGVG